MTIELSKIEKKSKLETLLESITKIVGTLISVFLWPPFIIIAVLIAFEFNSLASLYYKKE